MSNDMLAKNIRYNRKLKGMTQIMLAEALYVSPQTVSKWENGFSEPDSEKLCAIADLFGISLDNLLRNHKISEKNVYIAIDGGGTKTDFLLFSADGEIFDRIQLGGCNPNAYGLTHTENVLSDGIDKMVSSGEKIVGVFAGISGASAGKNREALTEFLKKKYPYLKIRVDGDIHNVINSVEGAEKCIAVISGTGSVAYGYDGEKLRRIGGWGYLFDEAGSGFDIGRDLFQGRQCGDSLLCSRTYTGNAVFPEKDKGGPAGKEFSGFSGLCG